MSAPVITDVAVRSKGLASRLGDWLATVGWGKFFLLRARRVTGRDPSETFHPAIARDRRLPDAPPPEDRVEAGTEAAG